MQMKADSNRCAHCDEVIGPGDKVLAYIDVNKAKTENVMKMLVHDRCVEAFMGSFLKTGPQ